MNPMLSAREMALREGFWQILDAHSGQWEVSSAAQGEDKNRQLTYRAILDRGGSFASTSGISGIRRVHGAGDR